MSKATWTDAAAGCTAPIKSIAEEAAFRRFVRAKVGVLPPPERPELEWKSNYGRTLSSLPQYHRIEELKPLKKICEMFSVHEDVT